MTALTAIIYDGKRIIPAPRLSFSKSFRRSGDQSAIGAEHQVTLHGTLVGCKGWDFTSGSPDFYTGADYPTDDSNNTCDKFENLILMQEKLRELFAIDNEYKWFEVVGCGGLIKKWRAKVLDINFSEDNPPAWTEISEFTISLALQPADDSDEDLHIDHTETWNVEFDEENGGIYTLQHTISTQSEAFVEEASDKHGWQIAKAWVDNRLAGTDYSASAPTNINNDYIFAATGFNLVNYTAYDYTVQRSIDEFGGTYSVTESWTLAKDPVFRTWDVVFNQPREDYASVTVQGEFRSLLNRTTSTETTPTNGDAALTAFTTWDNANAAYAIANDTYNDFGGCGTLGSCPVARSVTKTQESRGDGTSAFGEATRRIQFSYEFSDSDADAEVSLSKTIDKANIDDCETRVTISGNIRGYVCGCDKDRLTQAQEAYAAINCSTEADSVYVADGGTGTLLLVRRSYTENEKDGTIEFTCEFSDKFDGGEIQDERTTVGWTCGDLKSDGSSKTTYTVDGTIKAVCDGVVPTAPLPASYGFVGVTLRRTSVTTDDSNKIVNYNYEWDDEDGLGLIEITVETSEGPDKCGVIETQVDISVNGEGCDSATKLANALAAIATVTASDYASVGSCQISKRENINRTQGIVRQTYTFTDECDATIDVTITESYSQENCGEDLVSIEGEIKGACFATGGAMVAAEALYGSHGVDAYSSYGMLATSRVSRNEKSGTIRFNYEFKDIDEGYEHEQTIETKSDEQDCCSEITISGNIKPFCDANTGKSGQIAAGEAAWDTIRLSLATTAAGYCSKSMALRSTQVSRNKRTGDVSYSYTYRCCDNIVSGALEESITITKELPSSVIAVVPILGRAAGPIIQDKGTKTLERCSITIDLLFSKDCSSLAKPTGLQTHIDGIISSVMCCDGANTSYQESDRESWNPKTGRYTREISFVCEHC